MSKPYIVGWSSSEDPPKIRGPWNAWSITCEVETLGENYSPTVDEVWVVTFWREGTHVNFGRHTSDASRRDFAMLKTEHSTMQAACENAWEKLNAERGGLAQALPVPRDPFRWLGYFGS